MTHHVQLTALTETPEEAARAAETLSRALVGLGLEGIYSQLSVMKVEGDEDE